MPKIQCAKIEKTKITKLLLNMKKSSLRFLLLVLLMAVSIVSYAYLSLVQLDDCTATCTKKVEQAVEKEAIDEEKEIYMPDIEIIKKVLETGRRFLTLTTSF